uniref:Uncharacterized protein n=1 Tax=Anguilla anguilla TaxID=7936 RepID=A0A0E9W472_ANGAN
MLHCALLYTAKSFSDRSLHAFLQNFVSCKICNVTVHSIFYLHLCLFRSHLSLLFCLLS